MTPQAPKPSIHELATKLYEPNAYDVSAGLGPNFGSTIMIINGGLECTTEDHEENSNALLREGYYAQYLEYFGLPAETELTCALMQPFTTESASNIAQSIDKNWDKTNECKVVSWFTQYSVWRPNDYKSCVCALWAPDLENCLDGQLSSPSDDEQKIEMV